MISLENRRLWRGQGDYFHKSDGYLHGRKPLFVAKNRSDGIELQGGQIQVKN